MKADMFKKHSRRKCQSICLQLLMSVGLILLLAALLNMATAIRFQNVSQRTDGIIMDIQDGNSAIGGKYEINFNYIVDGKLYENTHRMGTALRADDPIPIYYDGANPRCCRAEAPFSLFWDIGVNAFVMIMAGSIIWRCIKQAHVLA